VEEDVRVHVVVEHDTMRELLVDLLVRERCVVASAHPGDPVELDLRVCDGEVLVIDEAAFVQRQWAGRVTPGSEPFVVVVATEDDPFSRQAALAGGARGWIPRERLGDDLASEVRRVTGRAP
jgi:DNA-binding NarL/FixJ family response regulator